MKKIDSLNLIPFIDIMLVLLVIVLVSASFVVQSQVQVDVPKLEETYGSNEQKKTSHRITINKEGHFFLDDRALSLSELKSQIGTFDKDTQVIIRSDRQSDLEHFLEVATTLRDMGIYDVYVTTEKK